MSRATISVLPFLAAMKSGVVPYLFPLFTSAWGCGRRREDVGMDRGEIKGKWGHDGNTGVRRCVYVSVST